MSGRQSDGEVEIGSARWPIKWDTANPLWDSCRLVGMDTPTADARVELQFWDADQSLADDKDDLIGVAQCTISQFTDATTVLELPIALTKRSKISAEKSEGEEGGESPRGGCGGGGGRGAAPAGCASVARRCGDRGGLAADRQGGTARARARANARFRVGACVFVGVHNVPTPL